MKESGVLVTLILVVVSQGASPLSTYEDFTRAIRANDLTALRALSAGSGAVNVESRLHARPLHFSVIYGSVDSVRILLDAGADVNAKNQQGDTALIYGAWEPARTKLLVDKGAQTNAAAKDGTTPLMVAATARGNIESVKYLLAHGADPKALDAAGGDALMRAARRGDTPVVELLLQHGADAHLVDKGGSTALLDALDFTDLARVAALLKGGANVNAALTFAGMVKNGPIALTHSTPLLLGSTYSDSDTITALLKAGAHVNDVDVRKMSPLILAIASDHASPGRVQQLIAAGADLNLKDQNGETALDWARKYGQPEIVSALEHAGAEGSIAPPVPQPLQGSQAATASDALARALPLLTRTGSDFFKEGGCNSCHHQTMGARVYAAAAEAGLHADDRLRQTFRDAVSSERPYNITALPLLEAPGGDFDRLLPPLMAMADLHAPATDFTDAAVHFLAARQDPSGAWIFLSARPPIEESHITRTAMAIRALKVYGWPARQAEFEERVSRAEHWLRRAQPVTTYEAADRITGLWTTGVSTSELRNDAESLMKKQRPDGGWAQTQYLASDAYATGLVLHSLYAAGLLQASDPAYRKGVAFLLQTQFPDGSWYVRSRAAKFQPYFQSGFPFNHDQWISSAGTAWAAIALIHAEGDAATRRVAAN